jgi:hypothetical protein
MENNKRYVDVFPNKILLSKPNENNFFEAKLTLTNLTNKFVVFKVYINKSTIYSANPSTSFISPKETTIVNVKRLERVIFILIYTIYIEST